MKWLKINVAKPSAKQWRNQWRGYLVAAIRQWLAGQLYWLIGVMAAYSILASISRESWLWLCGSSSREGAVACARNAQKAQPVGQPPPFSPYLCWFFLYLCSLTVLFLHCLTLRYIHALTQM
jgi:hypothetical protein